MVHRRRGSLAANFGGVVARALVWPNGSAVDAAVAVDAAAADADAAAAVGAAHASVAPAM